MGSSFKDDLTIIRILGVSFSKTFYNDLENFTDILLWKILSMDHPYSTFFVAVGTSSMYHPSSVTEAIMVTSLPSYSVYSLRGR